MRSLRLCSTVHLLFSDPFAGKFKEAERLYLTIDDPDAAIAMYKKNRQFDQVTPIFHSIFPRNCSLF